QLAEGNDGASHVSWWTDSHVFRGAVREYFRRTGTSANCRRTLSSGFGRNCASRGFGKLDFRAPLREGSADSAGPRVPTDLPDLAILGAGAGGKSHGDLRRSARLRPQRYSLFYRRPF